MKSLVIIVSCVLSSSVFCQTLEVVRESFHQAVLDEAKSRDFHTFLKKEQADTPTIKAYKAASEAMLARVLWNPFSKLSQVMKYSDLMDEAIAEDSENIEIRFLRLSIEYNLPKFLGMSKHLKEDRDVIVNNLSSVGGMNVDPSFCRYIIYFLNDTMLCSKEEIEQMESALKEVE